MQTRKRKQPIKSFRRRLALVLGQAQRQRPAQFWPAPKRAGGAA